MRKKYWMSAGLCVALLSPEGMTFAQGSSPPPTQTEAADARGDQAFLERALGVNQVELALGEMAAERGNAPEVKAMGKTMVEKHSELGRQLADLARRSHASEAPQLSTEQQSTVAHLASLSGSAFDASFKQTVDAGHVQELAMYRDEVSHAVDPELRALAERRVSTLEQTVTKPDPKSAEPKDEW